MGTCKSTNAMKDSVQPYQGCQIYMMGNIKSETPNNEPKIEKENHNFWLENWKKQQMIGAIGHKEEKRPEEHKDINNYQRIKAQSSKNEIIDVVEIKGRNKLVESMNLKEDLKKNKIENEDWLEVLAIDINKLQWPHHNLFFFWN